METSHNSTANASSKLTVPFYALPSYCKKTSAEIISEARAAIMSGSSGVNMMTGQFNVGNARIRPVNTKRPFTPRERERTLFGSSRKTSSRPPSSFSLGYLQFQECATPPSTTPPHVRRLNPLPFLPASSLDHPAMWSERCAVDQGRAMTAGPVLDYHGNMSARFRLPSLDSTWKPSGLRQQFRATASLDNLPEELEGEEMESPGSSSEGGSQARERPPPRKAYSSPIQRTRSIDIEVDEEFVLHLANPKIVSPHRGKRLSPDTKSQPQTDSDKRTRLQETKKIKPETDTFAKSYPSSDFIFGKRENYAGVPQTNPVIKDSFSTDVSLVTHLSNKSTGDKHLSGSKMKSTYELSDDAFGPALDITSKNEKGNDTENKALPDKLSRFATPKPKEKAKVLHRDHTPLSDNLTNTINSKPRTKPVKKLEILLDAKSLALDASNMFLCTKEGKEGYLNADKMEVTSDQMHKRSELLNINTKPVRNTIEIEVPNISNNTVLSNVNILVPNSHHNVETQDEIQALLNTLNLLNEKGGNDSEVLATLLKLYAALESQRSESKSTQQSKQKTQVLKTLYKFVERPNESLLLQIARIILSFRVSGNNLSAVCKLVFKVSRCDKNDELFLQNNVLELFVEALGSASPLEDAEACIYGYGALKFLTMNNVLLTRVLDLGILELMVLHMKMVNSARGERTRIPEQTSHALFQLTGALRNVAGEEEMFPQFVTTGAVSELCRAMELFSSDLDVISNVSRTLSIISTHDECCFAIVEYENCFKLFVKLFQKYPGRQDIIVRLGYALGNLMAKSDIARTKFYSEDGAVTSMLNLLGIYLEKDLELIGTTEKQNELINSDAGSNGSVEDVIVKMIRILANMSINPMVGSSLACSSLDMYYSNNVQEVDAMAVIEPSAASKDGERFLDVLLAVLRRKSVTESDELVHSVLSTLNNLSYYPTCNDGAFGERQLEIAQALSSLLSTDHKDCLIEATRVYGNLTRSQDTRDYLLESGGLDKLLRFLELDNRELLCTTAGILINMMADWDKRVALKKDNGIHKLTVVLSRFGEGDWQLATLVCQALWNYCIESTNLHAAFGVEETNNLLGLLADFLDEERLFGIAEGMEVNEAIATSEGYQIWEEFAGVATNLLEKMEVFLDSLEPLETTSPVNKAASSDMSTSCHLSNSQYQNT